MKNRINLALTVKGTYSTLAIRFEPISLTQMHVYKLSQQENPPDLVAVQHVHELLAPLVKMF